MKELRVNDRVQQFYEAETFISVGIYMFKVNNRSTRTGYEICSSLKFQRSWKFSQNFKTNDRNREET